MAREGQLGDGREDAQAIVGLRILGREDECGLRKVRPVRQLLHLLGGESLAVQHNSDRVALVPLRPEDIYLSEGTFHAPSLTGRDGR
jgi:hypothetical protein